MADRAAWCTDVQGARPVTAMSEPPGRLDLPNQFDPHRDRSVRSVPVRIVSG